MTAPLDRIRISASSEGITVRRTRAEEHWHVGRDGDHVLFVVGTKERGLSISLHPSDTLGHLVVVSPNRLGERVAWPVTVRQRTRGVEISVRCPSDVALEWTFPGSAASPEKPARALTH